MKIALFCFLVLYLCKYTYEDAIKDTITISGKISSFKREKIHGVTVEAIDSSSNRFSESIGEGGDFSFKGLNKNTKYIIYPVFSSDSNVERALPAKAAVVVGDSDIAGIEFVALERSKKVDLRGYLLLEGEGGCNLEKREKILVEMKGEKEGKTLRSIIYSSCAFVFRNLPNDKYTIRIYEMNKKFEKVSGVLKEEIVVISSDDKDIVNGIKRISIELSQEKKEEEQNGNFMVAPLIIGFGIVFIFKRNWITSFFKI